MTDINKYIALKTALLIEKAKFETRLGEISKALGQDVSRTVASPAAPAATTTTPGKRTRSEATKAKMRAAHQARWAKLRAKSGSAPTPVAAPAAAPKKKRKMSAEGKANIRAAVKARWAKPNALKVQAVK